MARNTENMFTTEIKAGSHLQLADEPEEHGGFDAGPAPYDYLLSSLAACTVMTLNMYADRKGIVLGEFDVHLSHERSYVKDLEDAKGKGSYLAKIQKSIDFKTDLGEKLEQRLLEIADRCPVHKTLSGNIEIQTKAY